MLKRIKEAIESIKKGEIIIMIDDEDRENEGDLIYSANFSTPEKVNFLATYGKGLICVALSTEIANRLELNPMIENNTSSYETAFTVSVDAKNALTGISASERDMTIKILADPLAKSDELVKPGHIFPLIAKKGGTLFRIGHTEGSVDLCRLAGLQESAVICEIMKDNGEMARRDDLLKFAEQHNLKIVYISDIVEYRLQNESLVKIIDKKSINFFGKNSMKYEIIDHFNNKHLLISTLNKISDEVVNVKFHHINLDVELLLDFEKFNNLQNAIKFIQNSGGILIFINSKNQDNKNLKEFGIGAQILKLLNITKINLLTSNTSQSFIGINGFGLEVVKEIKV